MHTVSKIVGTDGIQRRSIFTLIPAVVVVLAFVVVGAFVVDSGEWAVVLMIGVPALVALPLASTLQSPGHRVPWAIMSIGAFVVLAELVLHLSHSSFGRLVVTPLEAYATAGAMFGALIVSEVWMLRSRPRYSGRPRDEGTGLVIVASLTVAFGGALAAADTGWGPRIASGQWPLFVFGIGVALGGLVLRLWAVATLGQFFQPRLVVQDGHRVVADGPYRVVRHPSYTGPILIFVGIGYVLDNWIGLGLCVVLPLASYAYRIVIEERVLIEGLGDPYEEYRRGTWRIAPGIW